MIEHPPNLCVANTNTSRVPMADISRHATAAHRWIFVQAGDQFFTACTATLCAKNSMLKSFVLGHAPPDSKEERAVLRVAIEPAQCQQVLYYLQHGKLPASCATGHLAQLRSTAKQLRMPSLCDEIKYLHPKRLTKRAAKGLPHFADAYFDYVRERFVRAAWDSALSSNVKLQKALTLNPSVHWQRADAALARALGGKKGRNLLAQHTAFADRLFCMGENLRADRQFAQLIEAYKDSGTQQMVLSCPDQENRSQPPSFAPLGRLLANNSHARRLAERPLFLPHPLQPKGAIAFTASWRDNVVPQNSLHTLCLAVSTLTYGISVTPAHMDQLLALPEPFRLHLFQAAMFGLCRDVFSRRRDFSSRILLWSQQLLDHAQNDEREQAAARRLAALHAQSLGDLTRAYRMLEECPLYSAHLRMASKTTLYRAGHNFLARVAGGLSPDLVLQEFGELLPTEGAPSPTTPLSQNAVRQAPLRL